MEDTIAVLLPVYKKDNPEWFRKSLDSILLQTYRNFHVFIGVDGPIASELQSAIDDYAGNPFIDIVAFERNRGLACVLNDLLDLCFSNNYNYIARMDADDMAVPERLKKQLSFLTEHPDIDVVGGAIKEIDESGQSLNKTIVYPAGPEECRRFFSKRNPHAHPAVMFRKSFFDKVGRKYRPEYRQNQDTMLWYDGMKHGTRHANLPEVVLLFRMSHSLFKKRRNGWTFAKKQLEDRKMINKELGYGLGATFFAYCMFVMLASPVWVKKIAYKIFR
ncbi:glycosyltransferase [Phocaeicola abscessus]|uniref:glycosyltransferase n=1 Tax=Phocaeicola abscessus TaxID=555313 RepID=UPI0028E747B9|nr:glycosyltransferase [Phocaeicola abscessus]